MIEQSHRTLLPPSSGELDALERRASRQRRRYAQSPRFLALQQVRSALNSPVHSLGRLPTRFLMHAVVALVLPLAVALSQLPPGMLLPSAQPVVVPLAGDGGDFVAPVAPLNLEGQLIEGDAPLEDNGDIPVPLSLISRSEALAPVIIPAKTTGDRVFLRNGPGTEYDEVGRISGDTPIQVIGRHDDWYQIRERAGKQVYWISGEFLGLPEGAIYTLFEVQDSAIPAPPPPKVATVREAGLSLRDGPGTNYVSMTTFQSGAKLDLLERYQDWFHVGIPGAGDGWVKSDFLNIDPGIFERVIVAEVIPDPNPAMIGVISENATNLRKGPDSKYVKIGAVNAGLQVDVIGKYNDWFKIRMADGNKAWIFSDLLNVSAHVARRVPVTKDFPALPVKVKPSTGSAGRPGSSANLASIRASGDVASYAVQFNNSRYVYGGASPSRGFDCSGLTSYVYGQFGVNLPHSAAAQFSTRYGASVGSMDNLAPGDLVFFVGTTGRRGITHVALYIGGGRIIHATTPRYGVQVSNVYEKYWTSHYYGAIRVNR